MPFKIVRNDITKMNTQAIVNTANTDFLGCGEEELRSYYRKSLAKELENGSQSISIPLISTGGFGYPKEEGMRIAVDEINAFLLSNEMLIYLVVFGAEASSLGEKLQPDLEAYIDQNYVQKAREEEYVDCCYSLARLMEPEPAVRPDKASGRVAPVFGSLFSKSKCKAPEGEASPICEDIGDELCSLNYDDDVIEQEDSSCYDEALIEELDRKLAERLEHRSDTFSEYLLYLIDSKGMTNVDVYKRAIVDKRYFAKLKNNKDFHPEKLKALCLCVGARLNLDETRDLLARAGYALSPADMTDIIFSFFIEHNHFNVIDIDIQLEEHGLPCIIS